MLVLGFSVCLCLVRATEFYVGSIMSFLLKVLLFEVRRLLVFTASGLRVCSIRCRAEVCWVAPAKLITKPLHIAAYLVGFRVPNGRQARGWI